MQPHERIEDEQTGPQPGDGLGEVAPIGLEVEAQRRRGDDLDIEIDEHCAGGDRRCRRGQALRGSSEFHAWGDSNLYLRRDGEELTLTVEHRAAPPSRPLVIELAQNGPALALEVVERARPVAVTIPLAR